MIGLHNHKVKHEKFHIRLLKCRILGRLTPKAQRPVHHIAQNHIVIPTVPFGTGRGRTIVPFGTGRGGATGRPPILTRNL